MDFADLVGSAGVVQNSFRSCGFTGINVRHDADIAHLLQWNGAGHNLLGLSYQR
jgi:hypothetical protein